MPKDQFQLLLERLRAEKGKPIPTSSLGRLGRTALAGVRVGLALLQAGVALGLLTPVRPWLGAREFVDHATATVNGVRAISIDADQRQLVARLAELDVPIREAVSPVERLQYALHGWVAFVIMPLFALANAGVALGDARLTGGTAAVFLGVAAGLVLGKPLGIVAFSWIAVRTGIAALPAGVGWLQVLVVGVVAGIGFTMALFIASLAFGPGRQLEAAKLGILCASAAAGVLGLTVGRVLLPGSLGPETAPTEAQAGVLDERLILRLGVGVRTRLGGRLAGRHR